MAARVWFSPETIPDAQRRAVMNQVAQHFAAQLAAGDSERRMLQFVRSYSKPGLSALQVIAAMEAAAPSFRA